MDKLIPNKDSDIISRKNLLEIYIIIPAKIKTAVPNKLLQWTPTFAKINPTNNPKIDWNNTETG